MAEPNVDGRHGLLQDLKELSGAFEAALLTTFNAYPPFFEEVILRRLSAGGCRHVVMMMDGGQATHVLNDIHTAPVRAGRTYTLAPIAMGGSFHPKVLLLAGKKQGRVYIGSHNLTLAGYGRNRELTNQVKVSGSSDRAGVAIFRAAYEFATSWAAGLPSHLRRAVDAFGDFAPWTKGPTPTDSEVQFLGSLPQGPSLWNRLRSLLPEKADRITLLGPFFDSELRFARTVATDLSAGEVLVALQPDEAELSPAAARRQSGFRFVDASALDEGGERYLHAKALLVESAGRTFLVTGSANPTAAAWLLPPEHRNAEAVLLRSGDTAREAATALNLLALRDAPVVVEAQWTQMEARGAGLAQSVPSAGPGGPPALFQVTGRGFLAETLPFPAEELAHAEVLGEDGSPLTQAMPVPTDAGYLLEADAETRTRASLLRIRLSDETSRWGLLHHTLALAELATPGERRRLREALRGLEGDAGQLEELLRIVEKVVFDDGGTRSRGGTARQTTSSTDDDAPKPLNGPLGMSLEDAGTTRGLRRASQGDLALLLDALMFRLGAGLQPSHDGRPSFRGADDAEVRPVDLDTGDDASVAPEIRSEDVGRLADLCRRKTRALASRMEKQFGRVPTEDQDADGFGATSAVNQVTAVLGMFRALRIAELREPWRGAAESLVDGVALGNFVFVVNAHLAGPKDHLLARAAAADDEPSDELVSLLELLGWLAWTTGLDLVPPMARQLHSGPADLGAWAASLATWAPVVGRMVSSEPASTSLARSLGRTPRRGVEAEAWLAIVRQWGTALNKAREGTEVVPRLLRPLRPGDMALLPGRREPGIVLGLNGPTKVRVSDPSAREGAVVFLATKVVGLAWELAGANHAEPATG